MSKLGDMLEDFLTSIRKKEFRENKEKVEKTSVKAKGPEYKERKDRDTSATFADNKDMAEDDPHRKFWANRSQDPYQDELDKIENRIKAQKGLSDRDMRDIEKGLAHQDIKKDIYRSEMNMVSDEAHEKKKARDKKEEERQAFLKSFKDRPNDREHER